MKPRHLLLFAAMTLAALWGPAIYFDNYSAFAQSNGSVRSQGPVYVLDFLFDVQNLKPDEKLLVEEQARWVVCSRT